MSSSIALETFCVFPKIDVYPSVEDKTHYIGHYNKIIIILPIPICPSFGNHFLTIGDDCQIKLWNYKTVKCEKTIIAPSSISDIIMDSESSVITSGYQITKFSLTEEGIQYVIKSKVGYFKEFSAIASIDSKRAITASLNYFFIIFDKNKGIINKRISMCNTHHICFIESDYELENLYHIIKAKKKNKDGNELEESEEEDIKDKDKKAKPKHKIERDLTDPFQRPIGSANCLKTINGHKGQVIVMKEFHNERFPNAIISGGVDNMLKIQEIDTEEIIDFTGHTDIITVICLFGDNCILSGSADRTIRKWNINSRQCEFIIDGHSGFVSCIAQLSKDLFVSFGFDKTMKIWKDETSFKVFNYHKGIISSCAQLQSEKNTFVFGDSMGNIFIKTVKYY